MGEFDALTPFWGTPFVHVVGTCQRGPRRVLVSYYAGGARFSEKTYRQFQIKSCSSALTRGIDECFLFGRLSLPPYYEAINRHILDVPLATS